jgi:predicted PurR-regulated permease PerM
VTDAAREPAHEHHDLGQPGPPLSHQSPFRIGFLGGIGFLLAWFLGMQVLKVGGPLILIVVALFLAAGLNPAVEWFERRGLPRPYAVTAVIIGVLLVMTGFVFTLVPVISDQVARISDQAPDWFAQLKGNTWVQELDERFDIIDKAEGYVAGGDWLSGLFGGVVGVGLKVLSTLLNGFVVVVLTLYFLAGLDATKAALYRLAPASRRERVSKLGDRVVRSVGGYVAGAFVIALCAGVTSLIFLFIVGLGEYAVALAFVVALLDVIPMIGATLGAIVVSAIGFATDVKIGVACVIFYVVYQQLENYLVYPRVMSRSVDIPGSVTVIAALIGAGLLGVTGALLAIPTAAAILMITKEVFIRRQDAR